MREVGVFFLGGGSGGGAADGSIRGRRMCVRESE